MTTILISDDELVALAVNSGGAWQTPLPTVPADASAMTLAAVRGIRSLGMRGLEDQLGDSAGGASALVASICSSTLEVFIYRAQAESVGVPNGPSISVYLDGADSARRFIDVSMNVGLHALENVSAQDSAIVLNKVVDDALQSGVDNVDYDSESATGNVLIVLMNDERGQNAWRISRGEINQGSLLEQADGTLGFVPTPQEPAWFPTF